MQLVPRCLEEQDQHNQKKKSTTIENDELDVSTFEDELWSMHGLIGKIVPDKFLKECLRRLRQTQPGDGQAGRTGGS